jgi:hypothetical protein
MSVTRRDLHVGGVGLVAGASVAVPFLLPKYHFDRRPKRSRVAILNVDQYSPKLENILQAALQLFPIDVANKTVVLKLILSITFLVMPLTPTHHWSWLRPNVSAVWERNPFWSRKGQGISATRNWYSLKADMRTACAVRRSDLLT